MLPASHGPRLQAAWPTCGDSAASGSGGGVPKAAQRRPWLLGAGFSPSCATLCSCSGRRCWREQTGGMAVRGRQGGREAHTPRQQRHHSRAPAAPTKAPHTAPLPFSPVDRFCAPPSSAAAPPGAAPAHTGSRRATPLLPAAPPAAPPTPPPAPPAGDSGGSGGGGISIAGERAGRVCQPSRAACS